MAEILYVEDNPEHCELMRQSLAGHTVLCVSRAADAVRALDAAGFDLVIVDVSLPDSVGDSTLQTISQFAPRILAVSSVVQTVQVDIPFLTKENFGAIAAKANSIIADSRNLI